MLLSLIENDDPKQKIVDKYYHDNGPCCAGCDFWRWENTMVGECVRNPPNQSHDAASGLGLEGCSLARSTANLTSRDHWCGEFADTYDWSQHKGA